MKRIKKRKIVQLDLGLHLEKIYNVRWSIYKRLDNKLTQRIEYIYVIGILLEET